LLPTFRRTRLTAHRHERHSRDIPRGRAACNTAGVAEVRGDDPLAEILARLTAIDVKVDRVNEKVDRLEGQVTKLRTELSARIDNLADKVGFLRDDVETTFDAADRATRLNQDLNKSFNDQLSAMVRQIRTLDSRVRTLEDKPL
jgi:outer membrane murein-binding lipoprotein Lpp